MSENQKRVTLLSAAEIEDIYELPEFNEYERSLYFNFDDKDRKVIKASKDQNAKIQLMLKIGYFKAKQRLFTFDACQTSADIQYLQNLYFNNTIIDLTKLDPRTEKSQKQIILSHFGYESYEDVAESVKAKLSVLIKTHPKPHNTIRDLITHCEAKNIIFPKYRNLQDAYTEIYQKQLDKITTITNDFPEVITQELNALIGSDDGILSLNDVRYDQGDFRYTAITFEVKKVRELALLYQFSKQILPTFGYSENGIVYFSNLVEQYPASRLRKLKLSNFTGFYSSLFKRWKLSQVMAQLHQMGLTVP